MEGFKPNVEKTPQEPLSTTESKNPLSPENRTPEQREAILQALQPYEALSLMKEFTDEQIEEAKSSEEKFHDVLNQACVNNPEIIFKILGEIPDFWNQEQVREHINSLLEYKPEAIIKNFSRIKNYESPEEQKQLIREALSRVQYKEVVIKCYFSNPDIIAQFDPAELREMVLEPTKRAGSYSFPNDHLDEFVSKGILFPSDVREMYLRMLSREDWYIQDEGVFVKYFTEEEDLKNLKEMLWKAMVRKNKPIDLGHLETYDSLFSEEEKAEILREQISKFPEEGVRYIELMLKHLTPEETRQNVLNALPKKESSLYYHNWRIVLEKKILTPEEEMELWRNAIEARPTVALSYIDEYLKFFPQPEHSKIILGIVENMGGTDAMEEVEKWIRFIPEENRKEVVQNSILSENNYSFVKKYLDSAKIVDSEFAKLFNREEIRSLLDRQLELGMKGIFSNLKSIREFLGSDKSFKEFLSTAILKEPDKILDSLQQIKYLYQPNEIKDLIDTVSTDRRGIVACFSNFEEWSFILGKDYVWQFLNKVKTETPYFILENLSKVINYVPREEREKFIMDIIMAAPPVAYFLNSEIQKYMPEMTSQKILEVAQGDSERMQYAPKTLTEIYKRVAKMPNVSEAEPLLREAFDLYESINSIQNKGYDSAFKKIKNTEDISQKMESRVLETFKCLAMLSEAEGAINQERVEKINGISDAEHILFQQLSERMNLGREITKEDSERFMAEMETPVPFLTYYLQYEKSPAHKKILSEMFDAILNGTYNEWKYGSPTEEGLQEMKDKKLLPEFLTLEQYISWQQDDSTDLFESLASDSEMVSREIRRIILDNTEHIKNSVLEKWSDNPETGLNELAKELANLGQESALVNKELGLLRKTDLALDPEGAKRAEMLARRKEELETQKRMLVTGRSILRILNLLPQEISGGYLLEGTDRKKKGDKILSVLDGLKRNIPEEGQFVLENISKVLDQFKNQGQTKQNLRCIDSSRPKHLFEIGAKPVSSCQHYGHGSRNDCLLGYSEPGTKILILENEQGNIVARSVFRILSKTNGEPGGHTERIYASSASFGIARSIYTHASKKGELGKISIYTSRSNQDEEGVETGVTIPSGFDFVRTTEKLHSQNSRAPKVYVDSAGGARSFGKYTIEDLLEIKKK